MNRVITLSRQFGSGGAEIGKSSPKNSKFPFTTNT